MPDRPPRPVKRYRRWPVVPVVAGLLLVTVLAVAVVYLASAPTAPPVDRTAAGRLVADAPTVDLGRVPYDVMTEAHFNLTNTGGGPVRLLGEPKVRMLEGC